MARGFLTKANVKQIIKYSWGIGKPIHWQFEYVGKDVIYLSYIAIEGFDCIMEIRPTIVGGIVTCQLYYILENALIPNLNHNGDVKRAVWYRSSSSAMMHSVYRYAGCAYGDLMSSPVFAEALGGVNV